MFLTNFQTQDGVLIDGTEIPANKPTLSRAQQSTFSIYKYKKTLKILVGASPGGIISFMSPAYGGLTSDRQIVERSNLHRMCDPGDNIMADKDFDVDDLFAPYRIHINIPTFLWKKIEFHLELSNVIERLLARECILNKLLVRLKRTKF